MPIKTWLEIAAGALLVGAWLLAASAADQATQRHEPVRAVMPPAEDAGRALAGIESPSS